MVDQGTLDRAVADALPGLWARHGNRLLSPDTLRSMRGELIATVRRVVHQPFEIHVEDAGSGRIVVGATLIETSAERGDRQAREAVQAATAEHAARVRAIEADQRRHAEHPKRAAVVRTGDGADHAHVNVADMLADLARWQVPPDLYEGEPTGYRRALEDVGQYLLARARQRDGGQGG